MSKTAKGRPNKRVIITAAVKLQAADASQPRRRFSMVAYTGGPLLVDAYEIPIYIDFTGLYWNKPRLPALYNHEPDKSALAGQLDDIRIAAGELLVDGFFLRSTAIGREVQAIAEDGYEWQASVGADPETIEEVPEGQTGEVNGRTVHGPCLISRETCLGEVSFVILGADDRTSARIVARLQQARRIKASLKGNAMKTFEEFCTEMGFDPATLSDQQRASLQRLYDNYVAAMDDEETVAGEGDDEEVAAAGDEEVTAEDDEETVAGEGDEEEVTGRTRAGARKKKVQAQPKTPARQITAAAAKRAKELRRIDLIEKICAGNPRIAARALEQGWHPDKARLEMLRAARAKPLATQQGGHQMDHQVLEAALLLQASIPQDKIGKWYGEKIVNQAMARELRGASIGFVMDRIMAAAGEHYRGTRKSDGFFKAARRAERTMHMQASGGFSTLSLANILENVANKTLLNAYEAIEVVWNQCCAVRSSPDFKPFAMYRLDVAGQFRKVGPDGELKHISFSDAKYSNQLDTWGALLTLTRKMEYNDDLGAFLQIPTQMGQLAPIAIEEAFFTLLLANTGSFFHANNRNLLSGASSAFSIGGLTLLETLFANQVNPNNKPMLIPMERLLVPTNLYPEADSIYSERVTVETTTADKAKPAKNPHVGKWKPIKSPYLNNTAIRVLDDNDKASAISGQSSTAYYGFCDPSRRAAFGAGFLNGVQTPTIQSDDTDFSTLGRQWRIFFDFGVAQEDPTAAAKSAGT